MKRNAKEARVYFRGVESLEVLIASFCKVGLAACAITIVLLIFKVKYLEGKESAIFFTAGSFVILIVMMRIWSKYKSDKKFFCSDCDRLIDWRDKWYCPYCNLENEMRKTEFNFTIFNACKGCGRRANLLKCPYPDCGKLIELDNSNDGKIIILGASKRKKDTKVEMMDELKRVFESIADLKQEERKNPVMILRQLGILTAGQISLEEALSSGNPQRISQTIDELTKRLSETLSPDDLSNKLESIRKSEQFKFEKERIYGEYERKRTVRDAFEGIKTRKEVEKEYLWQREKILRGRKIEQLSKEEGELLEDLGDIYQQIIDGLDLR